MFDARDDSVEVRAFAKTAAIYAAGITFLPALATVSGRLWFVLHGAVLLSGLTGVVCSAMIYHWTRRPTWAGPRTFLRFLGTSAWLGLAATLFAAAVCAAALPELSVGTVLAELLQRLGWPLIVVAAAKLAYEALDLVHLLDRHRTPIKRVAWLLTGPLAGLNLARFVLGVLGGLILPWILLHESPARSSAMWLSTVAALFVFSVAGELLERTLFFMTAVAPRMPGAVRT